MPPNDLSGDLIASLDPASSVSAVEDHSPRLEAQAKARRRMRPQEDSAEESRAGDQVSVREENQEENSDDNCESRVENGESAEGTEKAEHQIDRLA